MEHGSAEARSKGSESQSTDEYHSCTPDEKWPSIAALEVQSA